MSGPCNKIAASGMVPILVHEHLASHGLCCRVEVWRNKCIVRANERGDTVFENFGKIKLIIDGKSLWDACNDGMVGNNVREIVHIVSIP